jgi:Xaa-Pro aminopeptidase
MAVNRARAPSPLLWHEKQPFSADQRGTSRAKYATARSSGDCARAGLVTIPVTIKNANRQIIAKLTVLTEIEQRRRAVSTALASRKIDALLVTSLANIRYLTGFAGSNALVLSTSTDTHFFTDPRYASDAAANVTCRVHIAKKALTEVAAGVIKRNRLKKIGFEPTWLNVEQHTKLKKSLPPSTSLVSAGGVVEELRAIKSPTEIELIRRSVRVNSEAYDRTISRIRLGMRERDIATELDYQMRVLGAEKPAFDTIVAAGWRSALPHAHPGDRRLEDGELLLIDMGAFVGGYASDMTRVSFLGAPPKRIRTLYRAVAEAQQAGISAVRAGVTAARVDGAARDVLKRHELERAFVHSTGHGLGLEIHEGPRIARKEQTKLRAGMVITIEPGAYIEGLGGVRIEDTVLVTEHGCEVLTPTSKEFVNL